MDVDSSSDEKRGNSGFSVTSDKKYYVNFHGGRRFLVRSFLYRRGVRDSLGAFPYFLAEVCQNLLERGNELRWVGDFFVKAQAELKAPVLRPIAENVRA